jgi:recombination protein RecA
MAKKKETKNEVVKKDSKITNLDIAKETINKKYGPVLKKMSDAGELKIQTISTGSLGLDVALGRGGLARGRVYEFYGPPSGGKTTLAISAIAEAQKRGLTCCFADIEHAADPQLFKAMGVNLDELYLINDLVDGEDYVDAMEQAVKSGEIDVAIFDSITALLPKQESEADIDADFYALLGRLMSKTLRRFIHIINETGTLLIFINQMRDQMGVWGNPEKTTGGNALPFYATGRIRVEGGETKSSRIAGPNGEIMGHITKFEIKKNKLAPPFRTHEINLIYGEGYDRMSELVSLSTSVGIIDKSGSWYSYKDTKLGQGELNVKKKLIEDEALHDEIRNLLIEHIGLKKFYEQNS